MHYSKRDKLCVDPHIECQKKIKARSVVPLVGWIVRFKAFKVYGTKVWARTGAARIWDSPRGFGTLRKDFVRFGTSLRDFEMLWKDLGRSGRILKGSGWF